MELVFTEGFLGKFATELSMIGEPVGPTEPLDELMEEVAFVATDIYLQRVIAIFLLAERRAMAAAEKLMRTGRRAEKGIVDDVITSKMYLNGVQQILQTEICWRNPQLLTADVLLRQGFKIAVPIKRLVAPASAGQVTQFGRPIHAPDAVGL